MRTTCTAVCATALVASETSLLTVCTARFPACTVLFARCGVVNATDFAAEYTAEAIFVTKFHEGHRGDHSRLGPRNVYNSGTIWA
jgi:hypothetical protein